MASTVFAPITANQLTDSENEAPVIRGNRSRPKSKAKAKAEAKAAVKAKPKASRAMKKEKAGH